MQMQNNIYKNRRIFGLLVNSRRTAFIAMLKFLQKFLDPDYRQNPIDW